MVVLAGGHVLRGTLVAVAAPLAVVVLHSLAALLPLGASMRAGRILGRAFHHLFRWRSSVLRENSRSVCMGAADSLAALAYEHLGQALLLSLQPPWRTATLRRALRTEPSVACSGRVCICIPTAHKLLLHSSPSQAFLPLLCICTPTAHKLLLHSSPSQAFLPLLCICTPTAHKLLLHSSPSQAFLPLLCICTPTAHKLLLHSSPSQAFLPLLCICIPTAHKLLLHSSPSQAFLPLLCICTPTAHKLLLHSSPSQAFLSLLCICIPTAYKQAFPCSLPHPFVDFMQDVSAGGVIVSSGHFGVWELLPRLLAPDLPVQALRHARLVYRPLHNAFLDWWLRTWRRQTTCMCLVAADASLQTLRVALELGGIVGLLCDQRPSRPPWIEANFLGRQTLFSHGIAALHTSTGCPVWFATIKLQRTQDAAEGFVLHLHLSRLAPRKVASSAQSSRAGPESHALVQAYADVLNSEIKETPYQYFWWAGYFALERCSQPLN
ncbi:hypothetical protein AB1Y20_002726 [Prymnesium parvum]|uniref:Uncharacterized protein n=1 Tax=Prymnesium parvum TaxID=97485 RepID=A0AB34J9V8_PRYPA